jgi:hypothetical protein
MAALASTFDRETVENGKYKIRGRDLARVRAFGSFLASRELPEALTANVIDEALRRLGRKNSVKIGFIRSCLFQLGDLFAERSKTQKRDAYLHERGLKRSVESCPAVFQEHVSRFERWLLNGMLNPHLERQHMTSKPLSNRPLTIIETIRMVNQFLRFCVAHNVELLSDIQFPLVANYQCTLFWHLQCKHCLIRIPYVSPKPGGKCANNECNAINSYEKTRRLARASLNSHISALRVFFDWAQLRKVVSDNPFLRIECRDPKTFTVRGDRGEMIEISKAIRRHDDAIVEKLCGYIVSPEADPAEAIVLYLIIFHLLSNADLRNLKVPSLTNTTGYFNRTVKPAEDFQYLYLPFRPLSRGHRSAERTEPRILFAREALNWLEPILERYYRERALIVRCQHQDYFLVGAKTARWNLPVTKEYVAARVRSASSHVLGGAVNPSDLRRTAADIFAERSTRRGAILTGMGYSPLSATKFNYLERYPLELKRSA